MVAAHWVGCPWVRGLPLTVQLIKPGQSASRGSTRDFWGALWFDLLTAVALAGPGIVISSINSYKMYRKVGFQFDLAMDI